MFLTVIKFGRENGHVLLPNAASSASFLGPRNLWLRWAQRHTGTSRLHHIDTTMACDVVGTINIAAVSVIVWQALLTVCGIIEPRVTIAPKLGVIVCPSRVADDVIARCSRIAAKLACSTYATGAHGMLQYTPVQPGRHVHSRVVG